MYPLVHVPPEPLPTCPAVRVHAHWLSPPPLWFSLLIQLVGFALCCVTLALSDVFRNLVLDMERARTDTSALRGRIAVLRWSLARKPRLFASAAGDGRIVE